MHNFIVLTISIISLIMGSVSFIFSTQPLRLSKESQHWEKSLVKFEVLKYVKEKYRDSDGHQRVRKDIELLYKFQTKDGERSSDRLNFDFSSSITDAYEYKKYKELKKKQKSKSEIYCYYDPAKPDYAVLYPTYNFKLLLIGIIASVFLVSLGLVLGIATLRLSKKSSTKKLIQKNLKTHPALLIRNGKMENSYQKNLSY